MTTYSIYDLTHFGLISFSGEDAQNFLQSQLSCDVGAVTQDTSSYGSYCTPKGRILASFLLWRTGHGFFMQLPAELREPVQKRLSMFILRSKVKVADASDEWIKLGIAGKESPALVERCFGPAPANERDVAHVNGMTILRLPADRFEIVVPKHKAAQVTASLAAETEIAGSEYWDWLDIRGGVPVITAPVQEEFVPQMVNLDRIGGVSFSKGCYPGQEIVARMHYLGRLKQRMYLGHMAVPAAPEPGNKLYAANLGAQSCGMLVSVAPAPDGGYDALAVIQTNSVESGAVHWKSLDGPEFRILPLPYSV